MSDLRLIHERLRDECIRRAQEAWKRALTAKTEVERQDAHDQAHALMVMSNNHAQTVLAVADLRPVKFSRRNSGTQPKTAEKRDFLATLAREIGTQKHAAIAAAAIQDHESEVRKIFGAGGKSAERKILNFLRNHGV